MHYVPFTYAGTVDAYKLTSEMATTEEYAQQNEYAHSLFVADYAVTHAVSWDKLHAEGLIFGKGYAAGSVEYTMRAPSGGSAATSNYSLGTPQSNEWDRILDKNGGYIKNWGKMESWGQDTSPYTLSNRVVRGYHSPRKFADANTTLDFPYFGFRPVLEVLNPDTLGTDGLKAVTLDLGGGKLGGSPDTIQIIVKTGESFTAPASDGLTRPEGATGNYFKWLGSDDKLYVPGDSVPADVTTLTARFVPDTYTVIVTTDTLPDGKTGKAYSHTLTAISTAPITWSIDEGVLPAGLNLNEKTGEISGIPTAAGTATFTVKAENSEGSDTRALSITVNNAVEQTPVRYLDADGKERFCTEYTVLESVIIEDFFDSDNKWYDLPAGWYVVKGDVTITPRLDTHGAVNLILTDDCHLTVPWGINVKEGDTFTIYAQSTAEASMGKLTACLPELSDHEKSVWPVAGLSGIGAGVRVWAANDNYYENEGTIIINGGNIHARGQKGSSAIGGSYQDRNVSSDGDTPGNLRQGGSITINGGIVCTKLRTSGGAHTADSFGIGTCYGNGGSVTINGGTFDRVVLHSAPTPENLGKYELVVNGGFFRQSIALILIGDVYASNFDHLPMQINDAYFMRTTDKLDQCRLVIGGKMKTFYDRNWDYDLLYNDIPGATLDDAKTMMWGLTPYLISENGAVFTDVHDGNWYVRGNMRRSVENGGPIMAFQGMSLGVQGGIAKVISNAYGVKEVLLDGEPMACGERGFSAPQVDTTAEQEHQVSFVMYPISPMLRVFGYSYSNEYSTGYIRMFVSDPHTGEGLVHFPSVPASGDQPFSVTY